MEEWEMDYCGKLWENARMDVQAQGARMNEKLDGYDLY